MRRLWLAAAIAVLALTTAASAQTLNQLGINRLNADAQELWVYDGLPLANSMASQELQKLVGIPHQVNSKTTATITRINSIAIDCPYRTLWAIQLSAAMCVPVFATPSRARTDGCARTHSLLVERRQGQRYGPAHAAPAE